MEAVYSVHDKSYLERFLTNTLTERERRRTGLHERNKFDYLLPRRTLAEVAGTVLTCDLALDCGLAVNLAGGTHHAMPSYGSGFCVVNDIAGLN